MKKVKPEGNRKNFVTFATGSNPVISTSKEEKSVTQNKTEDPKPVEETLSSLGFAKASPNFKKNKKVKATKKEQKDAVDDNKRKPTDDEEV